MLRFFILQICKYLYLVILLNKAICVKLDCCTLKMFYRFVGEGFCVCGKVLFMRNLA